MKKAFTLVELVVSMGIFLVVITIAVGAFVSVSRMKALTSNMKDSQQKTRLALELVTRLARQADSVIVSDNGKSVELFFFLKSNPTATKFAIETRDGKNDLFMYDCPSVSGSTCVDGAWIEDNSLFGGLINVAEGSTFSKDGNTIPATLDVKIYTFINGGGNPYFSDAMNIETSVALEGLK